MPSPNLADGIVVLVRAPLNQRDFDRFGVPVFLSNEIPVTVCDISRYLFKEYDRYYFPHDAVDFENTCRPSTLGQIFGIICRNKQKLFVDIIGLSSFDVVYIRMFMCVLNITCVTQIINDIPSMIVVSNLRDHFRIWSRLMTVVRRPKIVLWKLLRSLEPGLRETVLVGGEAAERAATAKHRAVIRGHAMDYDIVLRLKCPPFAGDKIVFIDQYLPHHPERYLERGAPQVDAERYYPVMRAFFDRLERVLGLPVIISAHPRAHYEPKDPRFGGREIAYGQTAELVSTSKLVISHGSTAINFAVLLKKPLLLVTTDELDRAGYYDFLRNFSPWFGLPVRAESCSDEDILAAFDVPVDAYMRYRDEFIKCPGSPETPLWQIVIDHLSRTEQKTPLSV